MANASVDAPPPTRPSRTESAGLPTLSILGIAVHCVDFRLTLDQIACWISLARKHEEHGATGDTSSTIHCRQICTVNPEFLVYAHQETAFAAMLRRADLLVPDGVGVLLAARLYGVRLGERVTGSDGIFRICERAADEGWRVYFLGAAPGVAKQTAAIMQRRYPGLYVAGAYGGSPDETHWPEIRQRLHEARADIPFVAYGHPRQDFWIDRHRHELPARVAMGVGGAFDFAAGITTRAPRWVRHLGLEWLHRLIRQPWRWRRMLALPQFVLWVLWERVRGR